MIKILVCGDSWTIGYGVDPSESWTNFINYDVVNVAVSGASNEDIMNQFLHNYNDSYDAVIIGWSGITRIRVGSFMNWFCTVEDDTIEYFKNVSLSDILDNWETYIQPVLSTATVPVLQYSVFGDVPKVKHKDFLESSYLGYLADSSNNSFKYKIPMFEFDWLNEENYKVTKPFAEKYFDQNWEKACIERENIRPSEYFQNCGHPNVAGHKQWASFINNQITRIIK
jgi:hypothetical protein